MNFKKKFQLLRVPAINGNKMLHLSLLTKHITKIVQYDSSIMSHWYYLCTHIGRKHLTVSGA